MESENVKPYVLGLDLGVQSLGWAVVDLDAYGQPCGLRRSGVRCFDSGVGSETEIASGRDESANIKRRQARQQRRQLWRRARRHKKVFHLLQRAGLLPVGSSSTPDQRHQILLNLDVELAKAFLPDRDRVAAHLLPYRLRAMALDTPLPAFAFGRALFHLAQRRGFETNRRSTAKNDAEMGPVNKGIGELGEMMIKANARTLGEYFAKLDPEAERQRIRKRWTARAMYLDEFEKIWSAQASHHVNLSERWKKEIRDAIFHQRPLRSQKSLVGMCELEPNCRRAPRASLEAQQFRYLQKVNDLEISTPEGKVWRLVDPEHAALRAKLIDFLETHAELQFKNMPAKLGLKTPKGLDADYAFNLQAGGEKRLKGNVTATKLRKVLGNDYDNLAAPDRSQIIDDLLEYEKKQPLAERFVKRYGIETGKAEELAGTDESLGITLEDGYASLSRDAMYKLLPFMKEGMRFATAREKVYGEYGARSALRDFLPPVLEAVPQLRNPVVCRGLTELRKVVNALIRQYGKPSLVRVELARDLKRSRKQREQISKQNRENENSRYGARAKSAENLQCDGDAVSDLDVLKFRLADECNWQCPYTGRSIAMDALVGTHAQFDVEHIIPFSRSLDNSFANKTLCYHEENRNSKRNRTPYEAYSCDEKRWQEILVRVKRFRGSAAHAKLKKFLQKEIDDDFVARQLQDTRYMSKLAAEYLGLLYGGVIGADDRRRVQVTPGRITAYLRDEWGLNAILAEGDVEEKNRADHRHHAIDAVVIALTDAGTIELLGRSAALAEERGHRLFTPVDKPSSWRHPFVDDVRRSIEAVNVSFRINRRVSGALHKETFYSKPQFRADAKGRLVEFRHVRKMLQDLSGNDVESIVDDAVRDAVRAHLQRFESDLKKAFADENNPPYLRARDGRIIPIRKVRVREKVATLAIGDATTRRYVKPGENHHTEIVEVVDAKGTKCWDDEIVTLYGAINRAARGEPVINTTKSDRRKFLFSLAKNEYVQMEDEKGILCLYRVDSISKGDVEFRLHTDARPISVKGRKRVRCSAQRLFKAKARKVAVDPLGNVFPAHD